MSQLGRPEDGTDAKLLNNLEMFIKLKPMKEWRPGIHTLDDIDAIEMAEPQARSPASSTTSPSRSATTSTRTSRPAGPDRDEDLRRGRRQAPRARREGRVNVVAESPGVVDVGIVKAAEQPVIAVDAGSQGARALGPRPRQTSRTTSRPRWRATPRRELWEGEKKFDVTVRFPTATREDLVDDPRAAHAAQGRLAVAAVGARRRSRWRTGRAAITRDNGQRYIGVRMNVRNRDLGSFDRRSAAEASTTKVEVPTGYEMTWGGEFENQQRAMKRLALVLPLVARADVLPVVLGVRLGVGRRADHPQRAVRAARRARRPRRRRHDAQRVGGGRLHRAARPGGAQRRARGRARSARRRERGEICGPRRSRARASGCARC